MKKALFLLLLAAFCLSFPLKAYAADTDGVADALPDRARDLVGDDVTGADTENILERILTAVRDSLGATVKKAAGGAAAVLACAILCALAGSITREGRLDTVNLAGTAAIAAAAVFTNGQLISTAADTVEELTVFAKTLLPALTTSAVAAGGVVSAGAKYAAAMLFVGIAAEAARRVVMPLIYMFLAASAASAAFGGAGTKGVAALIKRLTVILLTATALVFTVYLSVTGVVSGGADATAVKVTKTAISSLLPVVGGIVSDAADAVVSGAAMVRNGMSVFAMLAVLAVCIGPFLDLAVSALIYKFTAALAGCAAPPRIAGFIDAIGTAMSMALALAGTTAVMLFVSIISFMRTVSG